MERSETRRVERSAACRAARGGAIGRREKHRARLQNPNVSAMARARRDARRGTNDRARPPSGMAPVRSITYDHVPARSRVSRARDGRRVPRSRSRRRASPCGAARKRRLRTRERAIDGGKRTFLTVLVRTRPMVYGESCVYDVAVRAGEGERGARTSNKYQQA